jgi:hypothetical protein
MLYTMDKIIEVISNIDINAIKVILKQYSKHNTTKTTFIVIICMCILSWFMEYIGMVISIVINMMYPFVRTYCAVKESNVEELTHLAMYWIIYVSISCIESIFMPILKLIPLYYFLKIMFFVWCVCSHTNGAKYVYDNFIDKYMSQFDCDNMEKILNIFSLKLKECVEELNVVVTKKLK